MKNLPLLFLCFILGGNTIFSQINEVEKKALIDLYTQTEGLKWKSTWNLNDSPSTWDGVTIENGHVTGIRLMLNNLNGTLPSSISNLSELKILELPFNNLTGNIPQSITELSNLETFDVNGNRLTGELPASIGNLKNLKKLHVSSNKLSGTLPVSIEQLTNIEIFNVFDNNFKGHVPEGLAKCKNLKELMLADNHFEPSTAFSVVLLSNSGASLDLTTPTTTPVRKPIIATETNDDSN